MGKPKFAFARAEGWGGLRLEIEKIFTDASYTVGSYILEELYLTGGGATHLSNFAGGKIPLANCCERDIRRRCGRLKTYQRLK